MYKYISFFLLLALIAACSSSVKSDLCKGPSLKMNTMKGEWTVIASDGDVNMGFVYIFDNHLMKVITATRDYTTVYKLELVGSTVYVESASDEKSYCVDVTDSLMVLTQVLSEEAKEKSKGNPAYGHNVLTLKKVGN